MASEQTFDIDSFEISQLKRKLKLEKALAEFATIKAETQELNLQEDIRKLNLRIHQLQFEKWEAQESKEKGDGRAAELRKDLLVSRQEKAATEEKLNALRIELAAAKRESERLKIEVAALNGATEKSNKVLSEKIALAHEVATLRTENEALKAAQETAKANLAEKLSLQRQLTNVQLELENERKANKRSTNAAAEWAEQEKKLKKEVQDLKQSLNKETKAREKLEATTNKMKDDYETRIQVMASKIESTNKKLEVLKKKPAPSTPARNGLKRPSSLALTELEQSAKRLKVVSKPGAISEFSTTPFFKRQAAEPQTPSGANETIATSADTTHSANETVANPVVIPTAQPTKVLLKAARTTAMAARQAQKSKANRRKSLLSEITEVNTQEDPDPNASDIFATQEKENTKAVGKTAEAGIFSPSSTPKPTGKAPKKIAAKPRPKLLSSTIFNDDDGTGRIELDLGDKPLPALKKVEAISSLGDTFSPVKQRPTGMKRINVGLLRKKL